MIYLNLLSPVEKNSISKIRTYFFVRTFAFRIISLALIIATVFIFTYLLQKNNKESLENQIANEASLQKEGKVVYLEGAIKELNTQLTSSKTIQDKYVKWANFMRLFVENIPKPVSLDYIQFNTDTLSFRITGLAADRDSLLSLQEKLKEFPYFSNVTSPISNLAQRENISFEITGQLADIIYD